MYGINYKETCFMNKHVLGFYSFIFAFKVYSAEQLPTGSTHFCKVQHVDYFTLLPKNPSFKFSFVI